MKNYNLCEYSKNYDQGPKPFIFHPCYTSNSNSNFRTTMWTGQNMQLTLMCIPPHSDIGLEIHDDVDQFICITNGKAKICMGNSKNNLQSHSCLNENYALIIPAGTWHNIINVGCGPLNLYSLYAPPQHPYNTVHPRKIDDKKSISYD